uniref:Uncharacterized protein n=1 Tax=Kuenenia stuttgartiensis TaxID=174633 RepID=Q1PZ12_KUEST|nr:unknown protein [Candidatus Kuenenia stuttgartiensis]
MWLKDRRTAVRLYINIFILTSPAYLLTIHPITQLWIFKMSLSNNASKIIHFRSPIDPGEKKN